MIPHLNLELDEIMEISDVGEQDTYDMVIPENHCFFANGILIHNSGDIEAAADQVLFVHREEDKLEAELILAKQRYGKRAIVQVVWIEKLSKYGNKEWRGYDNDPGN